jgi:hypothetical protein
MLLDDRFVSSSRSIERSLDMPIEGPRLNSWAKFIRSIELRLVEDTSRRNSIKAVNFRKSSDMLELRLAPFACAPPLRQTASDPKPAHFKQSERKTPPPGSSTLASPPR